MGRFTHQMASYRQQMLSVMRNEFRSIFTDAGVVLILVLALIIYATVYSMAYGAQVLRNVPIGVVDECRTPTSRSLAATFNAGPNTYVAYNPTNMEEAKELFFNRKIYGVVYIPSDYEEKLLGGSQANVAIYVDASYFLMYRQAFQELVTSIGSTGAMVEFQRLIAKGADIPQAQATTQPVIYQSHNLFNPYLGYGTFVMPAIIMVIIQQTLLIGIGMIGGTWREFGLYRKLCPPDRKRMSTLPIVLGKATVYGLIYGVTTFYILGLHYRLFHYPMNGATGTVVVFMLAYLAACIFLGIAISTLFRYRENSLLLLLWTSIPLLMLSGVSYPREGIPDWLFNFGQLFPSSHGVDGFIRIQSMGASLGEVLPEIRMLLHPYAHLRRAGLHRHSPGDRPRTARTPRAEDERQRRVLIFRRNRKVGTDMKNRGEYPGFSYFFIPAIACERRNLYYLWTETPNILQNDSEVALLSAQRYGLSVSDLSCNLAVQQRSLRPTRHGRRIPNVVLCNGGCRHLFYRQPIRIVQTGRQLLACSDRSHRIYRHAFSVVQHHDELIYRGPWNIPGGGPPGPMRRDPEGCATPS